MANHISPLSKSALSKFSELNFYLWYQKYDFNKLEMTFGVDSYCWGEDFRWRPAVKTGKPLAWWKSRPGSGVQDTPMRKV